MRNRIQVPILIFAVLTLAYFLTATGNIEISDTYFSIQTAQSIVSTHSLSAEGCRKGYCYQSAKDGKFYSRYGLGLAFIFTPFILLAQVVSRFTGLPYLLTSHFLISFYNVFFGAGACVIMFYLAKLFNNSKRVSLAIALLLGLGTFCWRYSVWDFSEVTQLFFLLASIYCALKNSPKYLIIGGFCFCYLILLKAIYILYAPLFIIYIFLGKTTKVKDAFKRSGIFLSVILCGFGLLLLLNQSRFGNFLEFGYGLEANRFYLAGIKRNIPRLLYWLDKGVLVYNPLFILGALGYYKFFRLFRKEAVFFISIITLNLVLTASWHAWFGGWCWGPRFLVPVAPLWLLPSFLFYYKKGFTRIILISLIFISILIQGLSILQGNLEYLKVCNANNQEGLRKNMPAQIVGSMIMIKHKIVKNDNLYKLSEFGVDSGSIVDTSGSIRYSGFDLWYLNAARYFNRPALKFLPFIFLPFIVILLIRAFKISAEDQ
jgi:hypothetical protein